MFRLQLWSNLSALTLTAVLLSVLFLTGCVNPQVLDQIQPVTDVPSANRLLVQDVTGDLYTMSPDGTARFALATGASSRRQYLQPTWSPDGEHIAWTEIDSTSGELRSDLVVSRVNGSIQERYSTPFAPFYLFWSPDGQRLAYLSNWTSPTESSIALRLLNLSGETAGPQTDDADAESNSLRTLAQGQPLYFAWAPDGTRLLTHIANERIEIQPVDGEPESLEITAAEFPAPQWSTDGENLIYALADAAGQRLIIADTGGNITREVTDFDDQISFSLSPAGDRLAYAVTPREAGTAAFGPLYVVDLATSGTRELSDLPVMAFFWSPDGTKLAYLALDATNSTLALRWYVWDGTSSRAYATFVPSRTFLRSYLVFFDQYARSMTLWAPDSEAFAYAAIAPGEGSSIWVQRLADEAPRRIGRGSFVAWSPR